MRKFIFALLVALCLSASGWAQRPDVPHAIAMAEGYYVKGSKARRNHNPGNIRKKGVYVRFKNEAEGFAALKELLRKVIDRESRFYNVNMSIKEFGNVYADGHGIWAKNVAKLLGVQVTTRMWEILDVPPEVRIPITLRGFTL